MPAALEIRQVVKRFGALTALDGIDLSIEQGEFFGLLGPNGAGKTTLISALAGLARLDAGHIQVMGHDVVADYREARRSLGVVPQELVFDPFFSVRETLNIQCGYFGVPANRQRDAWIDEILENLDLTGKANANMRMLSGGMKRRVLVAQALVHRPPVIVLDEPTAGVDVGLRQTLWRFIRRLNQDGHTIVLTTHYLEEAESLCNRIAMLKAGRIVALDSTANLLRRYSTHALCFRLAANGASHLPDDLAACAENKNGLWHLPFDRYEEVEPLLAALRRHGCVLCDIEIGKPDLEDVFMRLTHDEPRPLSATAKDSA
jgi:ABC-2 type transport system ATP-binding protein